MAQSATLSSFKAFEAVSDAIAPPAPRQEESALHAFRIYFAVYSVFDCVVGKFSEQILMLKGQYVPYLDWSKGLMNAFVILGAVLVTRRRNYQLGALMLAAFHFLAVKQNFPSSGNHRYLEMLIYLSIAIVPVQQLGKLLRYAILTIFFYSGVQKLLYGYYWSGEIFALEAYAHPNEIASLFRKQLAFVAGLFSLPMPALPINPDWTQNMKLDIPAWMSTSFRMMGRGALAAEIFLPLLVLYRRTRHLALACLVLFSVYISVFANEYEFASTNMACLILFFNPRHARWALPVAFIGFRVLSAVAR
jgi:hypothetical protein